MTRLDRAGERLKIYEMAWRNTLPAADLWTLIRVDGKAFHTYLRGAAKPFDATFMADMDFTAATLCREVGGAVFAYVQSDEISVLVRPTPEPWFGGQVQKIVSVTASIATAALTGSGHRAAAGAGVLYADSAGL